MSRPDQMAIADSTQMGGLPGNRGPLRYNSSTFCVFCFSLCTFYFQHFYFHLCFRTKAIGFL